MVSTMVSSNTFSETYRDVSYSFLAKCSDFAKDELVIHETG